MVAFATMYSSSDEEEALLLLPYKMKKFPGLYFYQTAVDRILFSPRDMENLFIFQEKQKEVGPRNQFRA